MFTALKVLEMLDRHKLKDLVAGLPVWHVHKQKMGIERAKMAKFMEKVRNALKKDGAVSIDKETTRVDYKDYWILIRASGTEPLIRIWASSMDEKQAESAEKELYAKMARLYKGIR